MKEAVGTIPIFQIVIVLILMFTAIMCITINQAKAFGVKDEIINIIQKNKVGALNSGNYGITNEVSEEIAAHLEESGYRNTGKCPDGNWIGYDRLGREASNNISYCIRVNNVVTTFEKDTNNKCSGGKCDPVTGDLPSMVYYEVALFYQLEVPLVRDVFNFTVYGSTRVLYG